jgi:hypothetical protein
LLQNVNGLQQSKSFDRAIIIRLQTMPSLANPREQQLCGL